MNARDIVDTERFSAEERSLMVVRLSGLFRLSVIARYALVGLRQITRDLTVVGGHSMEHEEEVDQPPFLAD